MMSQVASKSHHCQTKDETRLGKSSFHHQVLVKPFYCTVVEKTATFLQHLLKKKTFINNYVITCIAIIKLYLEVALLICMYQCHLNSLLLLNCLDLPSTTTTTFQNDSVSNLCVHVCMHACTCTRMNQLPEIGSFDEVWLFTAASSVANVFMQVYSEKQYDCMYTYVLWILCTRFQRNTFSTLATLFLLSTASKFPHVFTCITRTTVICCAS